MRRERERERESVQSWLAHFKLVSVTNILQQLDEHFKGETVRISASHVLDCACSLKGDC